jgi:hypothetical protein
MCSGRKIDWPVWSLHVLNTVAISTTPTENLILFQLLASHVLELIEQRQKGGHIDKLWRKIKKIEDQHVRH